MNREKTEKRGKSLSAAELGSFCGQVALILEAGLPLYDGMETLAGAGSASEGADLYRAASRGVTETGSLYEALKQDGRWPAYLVEMVGIGERSGRLEQVMRGLEAYYAREDRIRSSLVQAVTYPLVLGAMLVVIVLILLLRVLPVFRRVLGSMGVDLGASGGRLMQAGQAVGWVVLAVVALLLMGVLAAWALVRAGAREQVMGLLQRLVPSAARLNRRLSASRAAGVLSMTLSGGFSTEEALEMTAAVLEDPVAASKMEQIRAGMAEGKSLAETAEEAKLFDELHSRMLRVGSATGREDQVLGKLAEIYEEQVEEDITRLVSIVEPSLVALLSVVIGAVLLSVMLPMAGILSSL